jgi:hypothetical protein
VMCFLSIWLEGLGDVPPFPMLLPSGPRFHPSFALEAVPLLYYPARCC